jgi:hypothetical protein
MHATASVARLALGVCAAAICALALSGCAGGLAGPEADSAAALSPAPGSAEVFDARYFAWSLGRGTGTIQGVMTYHQGAVHFGCQGSDVLLTPESAWSRRRMMILYGSARAAAAPVSIVRARTPSAPTGDYARFVRRTTCDPANRFTFSGLPDGSWFVITVGKPNDGPGESVALLRRVETHGGLTTAPLS